MIKPAIFALLWLKLFVSTASAQSPVHYYQDPSFNLTHGAYLWAPYVGPAWIRLGQCYQSSTAELQNCQRIVLSGEFTTFQESVATRLTAMNVAIQTLTASLPVSLANHVANQAALKRADELERKLMQRDAIIADLTNRIERLELRPSGN